MSTRIIGQEGGNFENKYASKNPIARYLVNGFEQNLLSLVKKVSPKRVHEVGCGEGHLSRLIAAEGVEVLGSDVSAEVIQIAQQQTSMTSTRPQFKCGSVYDLTEADAAPLMICCEVLEHLDHPEKALAKLATLAGPYAIFSVPREPVWRVLNMARGKYLRDLGNTPGHVQHWSKTEFVGVISKYFEIVEIKSPLPWTMLLAKVKS